MAAVVDEFGQVEGIISLQDVLEEIVGDIDEKHDVPGQDIVKMHGYSWKILGSVELEHIAGQVHELFPDNRGRTLGGFVMNTLGRIPRTGDTIEHGGLRITVGEMAGRRVRDVLIRRVSPEPPREDYSTGDTS